MWILRVFNMILFFRVISIDGTAKAGQDFSRIDEEITMKRGQTLISLNCNVISFHFRIY